MWNLGFGVYGTGNYDTYYNYRNPGAPDDPRLGVLVRTARGQTDVLKIDSRIIISKHVPVT